MGSLLDRGGAELSATLGGALILLPFRLSRHWGQQGTGDGGWATACGTTEQRHDGMTERLVAVILRRADRQ